MICNDNKISDQQIEEIIRDILNLLKNKYGVFEIDPIIMNVSPFRERYSSIESLKTAILDIIEQNSVEQLNS